MTMDRGVTRKNVGYPMLVLIMNVTSVIHACPKILRLPRLVSVYAFNAFYAWWFHFPQSGTLAGGTSRPTSRKQSFQGLSYHVVNDIGDHDLITFWKQTSYCTTLNFFKIEGDWDRPGQASISQWVKRSEMMLVSFIIETSVGKPTFSWAVWLSWKCFKALYMSVPFCACRHIRVFLLTDTHMNPYYIHGGMRSMRSMRGGFIFHSLYTYLKSLLKAKLQ